MSIKRLLLAGAYVLKELMFVCLAAHGLRSSGRLANERVVRSRSASRYAAQSCIECVSEDVFR